MLPGKDPLPPPEYHEQSATGSRVPTISGVFARIMLGLDLARTEDRTIVMATISLKAHRMSILRAQKRG